MEEVIEKKPIFFLGPCSMESSSMVEEIAEEISIIRNRLGIEVYFKASYDKANRTSSGSFRSLGIEKGLQVLSDVKSKYNLPLITDVHETNQIERVGRVVDIIQIPAFLCRQTDLLIEAGKSGRKVNIKKGQFMAPEDMRFAVEKVKMNQVSENEIYVTERGTTFGYHDLVVDMRNLPIMREFAKCIFDATHSTQKPGALAGSSGGERKWAPVLARAAAAVGVDGFFMETHPNPDTALSDGPLMIPLDDLENLIQDLLTVSSIPRI